MGIKVRDRQIGYVVVWEEDLEFLWGVKFQIFFKKFNEKKILKRQKFYVGGYNIKCLYF